MINYDFVVVGAGTMGRSTALYLTTQYPSAKCALIEQFKFEHLQGSSHSRTRIIRSTYPHPFYRDLCLEAIQKNWKEAEKLLNSTFIIPNPVISIIEDEDEFKQFLQVSNTSTNIKQLTKEEVRKKFPSAPNITSNKPIFYDTKAGIIMAQRYMTQMLRYLRKYKNIDLFEETQVEAIHNTNQGVTLKLKSKNQSQTIFAKKVSLNCGRWITKLVPQTIEVLKQVRQTVSYWKMKQPEQYTIGKYPAWIHHYNGQEIYSLPDVQQDGIKYAHHSLSSQRQQAFTPQQQQKFLNQKTIFLQNRIKTHFTDKYASLKRLQKCYYTATKTGDFLIDWTDQHQNVLICSSCSGHGFKFSPIIGKIVADLLQKDQSIQVFEKYRYLTRLFYHLGVDLK